MTHAEANSWCGPDNKSHPKCIAKYNGSADYWWLADAYFNRFAWSVYTNGSIQLSLVINSFGVRPVVDIPSTATISGSGTQLDPYVITQ